MFRRLWTATLIGCFVIGASAGPASAAAVKCGDKVSTDIVLTRSLTCSGDALHIVVSTGHTVRVNLNGHSINGDGTGTAFETVRFTPEDSQVSGNLVVSGGTVTGFASVFVAPAGASGVPGLQNLTFSRLRLTSNTTWLPNRVMDDVVAERSVFVDTGRGGAYTDGARLTVRKSKFVRSGISSASQSYNYLYGNTFTGGGFAGGFSSTIVALDNTFQGCSKGISMNFAWVDPMRVDRNQFKRCRIGLELIGMAGPVSVQGNSFIGNTQTAMAFTSGSHQDLTIAHNRFLRNAGDGVTGTGTGPTLVAGNLAVGNAALGVNTPGVTDGGGNVARRNGNPAQCVGVVCSRR